MTTPAADAPADTAPAEAPETPPADQSADTTPPAPSDTDDTAKWKAMARKHENDAKKLAKQLADAQAAQMSDQDKAISEAKQAARAEALGEVAQKLAAAELRAAGVPGDVIDDLNLGRYVTDEGDVNAELIAATAAKFASLTPAKPTAPSVPTGPQNGSTKAQLTRDDLARMTPEQIVKADEEGRLADLYAAR